jgi:hypothetical protein
MTAYRQRIVVQFPDFATGESAGISIAIKPRRILPPRIRGRIVGNLSAGCRSNRRLKESKSHEKN